MIIDFKCKDTQALMTGEPVAGFANIEADAMRKLALLHAEAELAFLRVPLGNPQGPAQHSHQ